MNILFTNKLITSGHTIFDKNLTYYFNDLIKFNSIMEYLDKGRHEINN